jgi:hypothetical protein
MAVTWMAVSAPAGPMRDNPRRWLLAGFVWELLAVGILVYLLVVWVVWDILICNRLGRS